MKRISEEQAWVFATAFLVELQGRVKPHRGYNPFAFDITESYRWIQIDFVGSFFAGIPAVKDPLRLAAYARMASIVWCLLAKCPGYDPLENPIFWKRVMSEHNRPTILDINRLIADLPCRDDYFSSVCDSVRIFDDPTRSFPSVWLQLYVQDDFGYKHPADVERRIIQVFLGLEEYDLEKQERQAELQSLVEKLRMYLPPGKYPEDYTIDVGVTRNYSELRDDASARERDIQQERTLPAFRQTTLQRSDVFRRYRHSLSPADLDDLFAKLPTTKTIRSVKIISSGYGSAIDFDVSDYEKLGNALFHPDSGTSAWKSLSIVLGDVTEEKVEALKTMSLKNDVDGRAPLAAPCIRDLQIVHELRDSRLSADSVLRILSVLGRPLVTLDVVKCGVFTTAQVKQLLSFCPNLTSLSISHDGSVWSESLIESPRLKRLHLHLDSRDDVLASFSETALETALSSLEVLRVSTYKARFEASREQIIRVLERLPTMYYFHWHNSARKLDTWHPKFVVPYEKCRQHTMEHLSAKDPKMLSESVTHYVASPTLRQRAALLSGLHAKPSSSQAAHQMDRYLVARIFEFASSRTAREVCVNA